MTKTDIDHQRPILTVDPGSEHTGIALWFYYPGKGWRCDHAQEISPGDFVTSLENYLKSNSLGTVVYESWQLYADKAQQQVGSELETVQLIGVIRYLVERDEPDWPFEPVQLFKQPASIKKATKAILGRKKVISVAKRLRMDPDGHAFDAELHGYHFLGQNGLEIWYPSNDLDPTKPPGYQGD